jgi:hypothetical protein
MGVAMNAVATKVIDQAPAPVAEGATLLAVIARAAADPQTDVEKMERLMAMYERVEAKRAESDFASALADMQSELPSVGERGNAAGRYTYALWEDINAAIKPVLQRFGFALSFRTDFADGIAVTGVLSHRAGHSERTTIKLPADPSGNKNAVQAVASSVSYGKRYAAGALLNLTSHGEDDDAYAAAEDPGANEWLDKIDLCQSVVELDKLGGEIAKAELTGKPRAKVRAAFAARKHAIGGAK